MSELLKPKDKAEFTAFLNHEIYGGTLEVYPGGPRKSAAQKAGVSPAVMGFMLNGMFPKPSKDNSRRTKDKRDAGAVFSLTRVCDEFGFDLDHCLQLFVLPDLPHVIEKSRLRRVPHKVQEALLLDADILGMLQEQVKLLGSFSLRFAVTLIAQYKSNKKPPVPSQ